MGAYALISKLILHGGARVYKFGKFRIKGFEWSRRGIDVVRTNRE